MTMRHLLIASLAPALLLGGCMGTQNRGLESVHQPVIGRSDYILDLALAGGALAPGEDRRLAGWMNAMKTGYGDRIAIDDPAGGGFRARDQVTRVAAGYGLLLSDDAPVTAAPVTPGTIRVVLSRMSASVPGCPDYSRDPSHEFGSNTSSDYGCATNTNLASMVARPADLVSGQGSDAYDAAGSYKVIDAYRKAAPTGNGGTTIKVESTGGK